ncbi:MAG: sulfite exporter TauE/SafE family protein [PVC group bacterium]|nr:sulfite exporter TauE/SafE family protein [PVC group bacterium]
MIVFMSAFWFGLLTAISPCPLASNIAAVSFLSKNVENPKRVLWSGIAYTVGRMFTYAIVGAVIITSLVSIPLAANFLQKYMGRILGPLLFFIGLFLLDIIKFKGLNVSVSQEKQHSLAKGGLKGAFALGVVFALSFCPISAALFFGSLIPLALSHKAGIVLPFFYGLGTAIPVVFFAVAIAWGVKSFSKWFQWINKVQAYAKKITGIIFILAGAYYIWIYILSPIF